MTKPTYKDVVYIIAVVVIAICLVFVNIYYKNSSSTNGQDETQTVVGVHIKGEVKNEGYYELEYNSRIKDAIRCAGGETENADLNAINLAEFIKDGQEIIIPSLKSDSEKTTSDGKININTADIYTLCKIKGIGEKLANQIIEYRTENGNFTNIEQLKRVEGIGNVAFEEMRDSITVS